MDRRHSIVLAILVGCAIACGSSSPSPSPTEQRPPEKFVAPNSTHSITISSATNPGTSGSPSIVTCVSESGRDTLAWLASSGTLGNPAFQAGSQFGAYAPPASCAGATQCASGNYNISLCPGGTCVNKSFDYVINVTSGAQNVAIYGRIIINR